MLECEIRNITQKSFAPYGVVIGHPITQTDHFFKVLISEKNAGWRIAIFEITRRETGVMENHPQSLESFEPISGTALLLVAENSAPQKLEVFLLDKPVCLYKGIWHQVITLSEHSQIKITENDEVVSEFYYFDRPLTARVTEGKGHISGAGKNEQ